MSVDLSGAADLHCHFGPDPHRARSVDAFEAAREAAAAGHRAIVLKSHDSPTASLKSHAGGIIASFTSVPASVHASTNVGPISISVPKSASYHVEMRTFVGSKTVTVPMDDASPHVISASSDLGSITISPS